MCIPSMFGNEASSEGVEMEMVNVVNQLEYTKYNNKVGLRYWTLMV